MLLRTYSPTATPLATVRSYYYTGCYCYQPLILLFRVFTTNDNNICVYDLLITKQTTIKMTADDDSCSLYDSISATDLTVGTTNSVTDTSTDNVTSSYNTFDYDTTLLLLRSFVYSIQVPHFCFYNINWADTSD